LQRVVDPPERKRRDADVPLVPRRHLRRLALIFERALRKRILCLHERQIEIETRCRHWFADRIAELGDDDLLRFVVEVDAVLDDVDRDNRDGQLDQCGSCHRLPPFEEPAAGVAGLGGDAAVLAATPAVSRSSGSSGSTPLASLSSTTLPPTRGSTR